MSEPDPADPPAVLLWLYEHRDRLPMWTVFDHPADYPDSYVARCAFSLPTHEPTGVVLIGQELEPIRFRLASFGLTPMQRSPSDAAHIMETWI
jgi:hypothetical protein